MSAPALETTTRIEPQTPCAADTAWAADAGRATERELDRALDVFLAQRSRLFRVAYRVTGDVSSAEDVVQEAWVRWQRTDRTAIENPAAFLITTTTRLAINVVQSARHRHETPAESPLSQLVDPAQDPSVRAEQTTAVEQTVWLLMARLKPGELAAYLLRKGFGYAYRDIAALLRTSAVNARQLVRRAQQRIDGHREHPVDPYQHRLLVATFVTAARGGDLGRLERLLTRPERGAAPPPLVA